MDSERGVIRILIEHFFRRFFSNDTIQGSGDTQTSVVRALSIVAMPGLLIAFFLQNQYPRRTLWGSIEDQYFFVMFSFVVMGLVAIFEWEMLFPDRLDFLILSPLSLKPRQMLAAKTAALGVFFGLFLAASNLCGTLLLPAVTTHVEIVNGQALVRGDFLRQVLAHGAAVLLAGSFSALLFLAIGGVLLCVLGAAQFRAISPLLQMISVAGLVLLMLQDVIYGDAMQAMLQGTLRGVRWVPTFWFLGVYERVLHGASAPAFPVAMSRYAFRGTAIVASLVLLIYPVAWRRMRRMTIEGLHGANRQRSTWIGRVFGGLVRRPGERAVFHYIAQTIARNNRYQVYLAMYCGSGLALAVACSVTYQMHEGRAAWMLSGKGLHAVMPLLLFWVVAGLRSAFAFPLNLPAAWVFRTTGVSVSECTAAARRWVMLCAVGVVCATLAVLGSAGWDARRLLVQVVCGVGLAVLLTDGFFLFQRSVPFTRPTMPGKTSLPLMLTLYVGVLPVFLVGMVRLEMWLEEHPFKLLLVGAAAVAIHLVPALMRRSDEIDEEMEGYEGEFQLLGLAGR